MNRLTEKDILTNDYTYSCSINRFEYGKGKQEILNKLGKLEDLEEQLGCPLDVYVKATTNGIIVDGSKYQVKVRKDNYGYYFILSNGSCYPFYLKNYKKSWWLKSDKSE